MLWLLYPVPVTHRLQDESQLLKLTVQDDRMLYDNLIKALRRTAVQCMQCTCLRTLLMYTVQHMQVQDHEV